MRGIRPIERQAEKDRKDGDDDGESGLVRATAPPCGPR